MQTYQVDTPDGASYKVEAENDQQAQAAIASYLPQDKRSYSEKTVANIIPDIKDIGQNLKGIATGPALNLMAGDIPGAIKGFTEQGQKFAENPVENLKQMARPVAHPVDYFQEHPVQQTLNVVGLLSGLKGLGGASEGSIAETAASRIKSRTISQALDLNPAVINRLATKAKITPEAMTMRLNEGVIEHLPKDFVSPGASANTKLGTVLKTQKQIGNELGKIFSSVDEGTQGKFPEGQEAIDALHKAAEDYGKIDGGDKAISELAVKLEKLQKDGKLDFDKLHKYQSDVGSGFQEKNTPPGTHEAFDVLNDATQNAVDRLSVEDPALATDLQRLKGAYTLTSRLAPAMARKAAREVGGASIGGGLGSKAIPAFIGNMIGGVPGALLGAGAKYVQEAVAPDLGKNLSYMAMNAAPGVGNALSKTPLMAAGNMAAQSTKSDPLIADLISKLKKKFDDRRKM